jgi:hypothetical protein
MTETARLLELLMATVVRFARDLYTRDAAARAKTKKAGARAALLREQRGGSDQKDRKHQEFPHVASQLQRRERRRGGERAIVVSS